MFAIAVRFPTPIEQRAVARVLGALDDKIELNRRMSWTLEEMGSAVFRSWFVDLDPVVAKAAGRKPFGLASEIPALFRDSFAESKLGPIPAGWHVRRLADVARINGRSIGKGYAHDEIEYGGISSPKRKRCSATGRGRHEQATTRFDAAVTFR